MDHDRLPSTPTKSSLICSFGLATPTLECPQTSHITLSSPRDWPAQQHYNSQLRSPSATNQRLRSLQSMPADDTGRLSLRGGAPGFSSTAARWFGRRKRLPEPPLGHSKILETERSPTMRADHATSGTENPPDSMIGSGVSNTETLSISSFPVIRTDSRTLKPSSEPPRPSSHLPSLTPSFSPWEWINGIPPGLDPEEKRLRKEALARDQALYPPKTQEDLVPSRKERPRKKGTAEMLMKRRKAGSASPVVDSVGGNANIDGWNTITSGASATTTLKIGASENSRVSELIESIDLSTKGGPTKEKQRGGYVVAAEAHHDLCPPERNRKFISDPANQPLDTGERSNTIASVVSSEAMFNPAAIEHYPGRNHAGQSHKPTKLHCKNMQNITRLKSQPLEYLHELPNPPSNHKSPVEDPGLGSFTSAISSQAMFEQRTYENLEREQFNLEGNAFPGRTRHGISAKDRNDGFVYGLHRPSNDRARYQEAGRHDSLATEVFFEVVMKRAQLEEEPKNDRLRDRENGKTKGQAKEELQYQGARQDQLLKSNLGSPHGPIDSFKGVSERAGIDSASREDTENPVNGVLDFTLPDTVIQTRKKDKRTLDSTLPAQLMYKRPYETSTSRVLTPTRLENKVERKVRSPELYQAEDSMSIALEKLERAARSHERPPSSPPHKRAESWLASPYFQPPPAWNQPVDVDSVLGFHVPKLEGVGNLIGVAAIGESEVPESGYSNPGPFTSETAVVRPPGNEAWDRYATNSEGVVRHKISTLSSGNNVIQCSKEQPLDLSSGGVERRSRYVAAIPASTMEASSPPRVQHSKFSDAHRSGIYHPLEQIEECSGEEEETVFIGLQLDPPKPFLPHLRSTPVLDTPKSSLRPPIFSPRHSLNTTRLLRRTKSRHRSTMHQQPRPQGEDVLSAPCMKTVWNSATFCFHENNLHQSLDHLRQIGRSFPPGSQNIPNSALLFTNIGLLHAHLGDYMSASRFFAKACFNEPQTSLFWFLLGCMMWELEIWGRAKLYFDAGWWTFPKGVQKVDYEGRGLRFLLEKRCLLGNGHVAWYRMRKRVDGIVIPEAYKDAGIARMPGGRMFISASGGE